MLHKFLHTCPLLGHTKLIFCFSDLAGLFLADLIINIPDIMIVAGQEYSLEKALLACYWYCSKLNFHQNCSRITIYASIHY